ncbi:MAG TPA: serine hydrolase [Pyrinomonadaceae bacterium]
MKRAWKPLLSLTLAAGVLNVSLLSGSVAAQTSAPQTPAARTPAPLRAREKKEQTIARLERLIPQLMAEGDVPGLSVALVRGGELVWHRGFGVRNSATKEPVGPDTVFEAASLSKPVFAYAVLKLVDAGKLDLDAPLNKYLPGNYDVGEDARLAQITARRVLSHTTGFPNWRPRSGADTALKIFFTPGERFSYSGEGFVYLAKAVEQLTGEKFDSFMKRTVFDPLGMTSSSYVWQDRFDALKIFTHNAAGLPAGQNKPERANAAASLQTTAADYGRFVAAVLKGTGLKRATARLMVAPQVKVGAGSNSITRPLGELSPNVSWGLGWGLQTTDDGVAVWHWGDNGNTKAFVVAYPEQKTGVVFFTNSANGLSIARELVGETIGGRQPALDWINYESYNSPGRTLFKSIMSKGAVAALRDYREWRKGHAAEALDERAMNRLGYDLLNMKKVAEAIEVFKQNVEDYPQSSNVYDSLGEAYMKAGDKEQAIKNYQRSVELDPNNTAGAETLKKLQTP